MYSLHVKLSLFDRLNNLKGSLGGALTPSLSMVLYYRSNPLLALPVRAILLVTIRISK